MSFQILGTGSALPARSVSNEELSGFLDTSDEWIFSRTGIKSRRVCTTETLDDLGASRGPAEPETLNGFKDEEFIELAFLGGRERLAGRDVRSLITYEEE